MVEPLQHAGQHLLPHALAHVFLVEPHLAVDARGGGERDPLHRAGVRDEGDAVGRLRFEPPDVAAVGDVLDQRAILRQGGADRLQARAERAARLAIADALGGEARFQFLLLFLPLLPVGHDLRRIGEDGTGGIGLGLGEADGKLAALFHEVPHLGIAGGADDGFILQQGIEHDALGPEDDLRHEVGVVQRGGEFARLHGLLEAEALAFRGEGEDAVERGLPGLDDLAREPGGLAAPAELQLEEGEIGGDLERIGVIFSQLLGVDAQGLLVERQRLLQLALGVIVTRERGEAVGVFVMAGAERLAADFQRLGEERLGLGVALLAVIEQGELHQAAGEIGVVRLGGLLLDQHGTLEERGGLGVVALEDVEAAELADGGDGDGVIRPEGGLADLQRAEEIGLGFGVIAEAAIEQGEVVQRGGDGGAGRAEGFFAHGEGLKKERLGGGVVAGDPVERGEVVPGDGGDGALQAERLFLDGDGLAVEGFRELEVAPVVLQHADGVEDLCDGGLIAAEEALADFAAAIERLLRRLVLGHVAVEPAEIEQGIGGGERVTARRVLLDLQDAEAQLFGDIETMRAEFAIGLVVQGLDEGGDVLAGLGGARLLVGLLDGGGIGLRREDGRGGLEVAGLSRVCEVNQRREIDSRERQTRKKGTHGGTSRQDKGLPSIRQELTL